MPQSLWECNRRNARPRHFVSGFSIFIGATVWRLGRPMGLQERSDIVFQGVLSELIWFADYSRGITRCPALWWPSDSRRSNRAARLKDEPTSHHSTTMRWFQ